MPSPSEPAVALIHPLGARLTHLREAAAVLCFLAAIAVLAMHFRALPPQIHTPINGGGAHGMGPRSQLWLLVVMAGWVYVLMSLINLVGAEAADRQATFARAKAWLGWPKLFLMAGLLVWIILLVQHPRLGPAFQ